MNKTERWFYFGMNESEKHIWRRYRAWDSLVKINYEFARIMPEIEI